MYPRDIDLVVRYSRERTKNVMLVEALAQAEGRTQKNIAR